MSYHNSLFKRCPIFKKHVHITSTSLKFERTHILEERKQAIQIKDRTNILTDKQYCVNEEIADRR